MKHANIFFPVDFDDYAPETELKGWCEIMICFDGAHYQLAFYDAVRLMQEVNNCLSRNSFFLGQNIVVLNSVNRDAIEKAVVAMSEPNYFVNLRPEAIRSTVHTS